MTETASSQPSSTTGDDLSWVLKPIADTARVRHAVIASSDGMLVAKSESLDRDTAEGIAAMSCSGISAIRAAADQALNAPSPIETVTTVSKEGIVIIMPAAYNTFLVVAGERDMAIGTVANTVALQARKLGEKLMSVPARDTGDTPS
ncbi:roadblock/LC7 domain-containing protein (plasmid) [Streptomyces sp. NBC_00015]|uniref:roadblock/LC7 domain-containing protein n=1 Tax=Streptomyces sp. NBC_00015 TaxID=2903611 RepID=UPI002F91524B